jgi:hypothetical protein
MVHITAYQMQWKMVGMIDNRLRKYIKLIKLHYCLVSVWWKRIAILELILLGVVICGN